MAQQFWLGTEDGPGGINLLDRGRVTVLNRGFRAPAPADGLRERVVTIDLRLSGASVGDWKTVRAEIDLELERIQAKSDRIHRTAGVLSVTIDGEAWTYIDVMRGSLDVTELLPRGKDAFATLTLTCLREFRGDAIQAQNLLTAPTDPTNAAWTATNVTATANDATAPDGSDTAGTLLETVDSGEHGIAQSVTKPAASAAYTASVYVKPNGRTRVRLGVMSGANGARATFLLSGAGSVATAAATVGTGWSGASAAIADAGGGWYRLSVTATSDTTTTATLELRLDDGSGVSYAGNASLGVRVWGLQVEEGSTAGLLLVPTVHPDTVTAAYTIPAYTLEAVSAVYSNDADNLIPSPTTWTANQSTETASQADPAGGTASSKFVANTNNSTHYARSDQATVSTGANTAAVYLKQNGSSSSVVRVLFSGLNTGTGYVVTVDFSAGTVTSPTLVGGTGYSNASSEIIDMGGGWYWVRITQTMGGTSSASIYITYANSNPAATYIGTANHGVQTWRAQIVAGSTIDEPTAPESEEFFPAVDVPAVTEATGKPSGAWVYDIPGDSDALYRVELEDASSTVAVNRVHVGAWSGPGLLAGSIAPFGLLTASDDAASVSAVEGQVGEWVATLGADRSWTRVGTVALADVVGRGGLADIVARVRDESPFITQPASLTVEVSGGAYFRRLARVADTTGAEIASIDVGRPVVTPNVPLVLMVQGYKQQAGLGDTATSTASISATGGLTWTEFHTGSPRGAFKAWYAVPSGQLSGTITVAFSDDVKWVTATLLELVGGASASPLESDTEDTVVQSRTTTTEMTVTAGPLTNTQAHAVYLSAGLGLNTWGGSLAAITRPDTNDWEVVSSLSSGAIAYLTVTTSASRDVEWNRPVDGAIPEEWIATLAVFKAASATGSSITAGEWSIVVTAVDSAGNESLPTGVVSVTAPSTSSAVSVSWDAPLNGTPAKYRVYRNRGSGWAYTEVTAPATSYVFTTESGLTTADPPTVPPPVAAWRLSVALPSGETLWRAQTSVSSQHANAVWEDLDLGSVPLPAIAAGEGTTPEDALLVVEAAHLTGAQVQVNGLWAYGTAAGQVRAYRAGLDAETTPDWVIDTNRDGVTSAWLRDTDGTDAGQPVVAGRLTLNPGNAQLVIRPEVAGGESDLVGADLRVSRVLVTPRFKFLRGRTS